MSAARRFVRPLGPIVALLILAPASAEAGNWPIGKPESPYQVRWDLDLAAASGAPGTWRYPTLRVLPDAGAQMAKRLAALGVFQQLREAFDSSNRRALLASGLADGELLSTRLGPSNGSDSREHSFANLETGRVMRTLLVSWFPANASLSVR